MPRRMTADSLNRPQPHRPAAPKALGGNATGYTRAIMNHEDSALSFPTPYPSWLQANNTHSLCLSASSSRILRPNENNSGTVRVACA